MGIKLSAFVEILFVAFFVSAVSAWAVLAFVPDTIPAMFKSGAVSAVTVAVGTVMAKYRR